MRLFGFFKNKQISRFTRWIGIYMICLVLGAMNIGAFGSMLKIIAVIPVLIWLIENHRASFSKLISFASFYVIWIVLSYVWSIDRSASLSRIISQVTFLLLLISVAGYRYNQQELDYLKKCLVWSSRITAIFVLISGSYIEGRIYLRNGLVREDPNYLCAYFSFAIVCVLMGLLSGEIRGKDRVLSIGEILIFTYIVFGTGSRGGLFAILVSVSLIILYTRSEKKGSLTRKIMIIVIMAVVTYVATRFIDQNIVLRFTLQEIKESNGTGRYEIWECALNAFRNSTFLRQTIGYGTATARDITYLFPFRSHNVFHNMFIENLLEIGVVGLVFYLIHILTFLISAFKVRDVFCIAVISCMIALSISTSIYTFKPYWNIMVFILCTINKESEIIKVE